MFQLLINMLMAINNSDSFSELQLNQLSTFLKTNDSEVKKKKKKKKKTSDF